MSDYPTPNRPIAIPTGRGSIAMPRKVRPRNVRCDGCGSVHTLAAGIGYHGLVCTCGHLTPLDTP